MEHVRTKHVVELSKDELYMIITALKPWENKHYSEGEEYTQSVLRKELINIDGRDWW